MELLKPGVPRDRGEGGVVAALPQLHERDGRHGVGRSAKSAPESLCTERPARGGRGSGHRARGVGEGKFVGNAEETGSRGDVAESGVAGWEGCLCRSAARGGLAEVLEIGLEATLVFFLRRSI